MTLSEKFPISLKERQKLDDTPQRFPGSLEEFVQLADACDYPIEFENGNIIAMSIASDLHEQIVANILAVLVNLLKGNPDYKRYGGNRHVFIPAHNCAYSPDASIVKGEAEIFEYARGKTANTNPWLVAEVLSGSTRMRDYGEKLPKYREIPSVKYILFIEQDRPLVTVFSRMEDPGRWQSIDYNAPEQSFELEDRKVNLSDIYDNIKFEEPSPKQ